MSISGVTFANQEVTPEAMGALCHTALTDGWLGEKTVAVSGTTITVPAGWFLAAGRVVRYPSSNPISVSGHTSGYARVRLRLDLSGAATEQTWSQAAFYTDYASTPTGFSALTQQDLSESGTIYDVEICVVALGSSGVTSVVRQIGSASGSGGTGPITDLDVPGVLTAGTLKPHMIVLDSGSFGYSTPSTGVEGQLFFVEA